MTVKIKNKKLYAAYTKDKHSNKFRVQQVLNFINRLEGVLFQTDDFFAVIDAIKDNEKVELVEPKLLAYVPLVGSFCAQYYHGHLSGEEVSVNNMLTHELGTEPVYQFTQEEVDKLKVTHPFIKTKEVEE